MKYLIRVVWTIKGEEVESTVKRTKYIEIAEAFFKNYSILMEIAPILEIKRVSLYEDGYEIERRIK